MQNKKDAEQVCVCLFIGTPEWNRTTAHGSGGLITSLETVDITSFAYLWSHLWSHSLIFSSEKGLLYVC